jgi:adenylate cyclase
MIEAGASQRSRTAFRPARFGGGVVFAAILASLLVLLNTFYPRALRFEHNLSDWRTGVLSDRLADQHPRVALVMIDERTLRKEPYSSPVDRGLLARLVDKLDAIGVKAIGLDIVFYKPTETTKDDALIAALRRARARIVIAAGDSRAELHDDERQYQEEFLRRVGRPAGYVNLDKDRDDVVRWKLGPAPDGALPSSFPAMIASVDGANDPDPTGRIAWLRRAQNGSDAFFTINADDLIGESPIVAIEPFFRDRLVLIGGRFADRDRHRIPLSADDGDNNSNQVHGVFIHAQVLAQMLDGRRIIEPLHAPVLFIVALLGFYLGWTFHQHGFSWMLGGGATAVLIAVDLLVFWRWRVVLPYTPVTIAWFGSVLGGLAVGRATWLYQRLKGGSP